MNVDTAHAQSSAASSSIPLRATFRTFEVAELLGFTAMRQDLEERRRGKVRRMTAKDITGKGGGSDKEPGEEIISQNKASARS